jgi:hypothetical protein
MLVFLAMWGFETEGLNVGTGVDRLTAEQAGQGPLAKAAPKYVKNNLELKGFTL